MRTGPERDNISILVIPLKDNPGVTCRSMDLSIGKIAGTTFIEFDDVLVPAENLVGVEGEGLKYVLTNFNHERLFMAISATVQARKVLSTTVAYTSRREAFGKALIDHPVVRHRIAKAGTILEAEWARIEQLTYALKSLSKADADSLLGGRIAMAKVGAAKVLEKCVSHAQLLFGGNSVTRTGRGELIESKCTPLWVAILA